MSFFKNIFKQDSSPKEFINDLVQSILEKGGFELSFDLEEEKTEEDNKIKLKIDFFGQDEGLLLKKEGALLDEIQFFLKKVLRFRFPESPYFIFVDCDSFKLRKEKKLMNLVEKLAEEVLSKKKSALIRPLDPRNRRKVYEFLESYKNIKAQSLGNGMFKKIKIYYKS